MSNAFNYSSLTKKENFLLVAAINDKSKVLTVLYVLLLKVNNVFTDFIIFTKKQEFNSPVGIKISMMGNPAMGKKN